MITEGDKRNIEAIKSHLGKLITLYIRNGKQSVDWEKASWIDTLETIVYNLENSVHYFKPASLEDVDNNFYTCECKCGWWGSSKFFNWWRSDS